jgi:hypothetical protein
MKSQHIRFSFYVLLGSVCLLMASLFWSHQKNQATEHEKIRSWNPFYSINPSSIRKITFTHPEKDFFVLEKSTSNHWRITHPFQAEADQEAVASLIKTLKTTHTSTTTPQDISDAKELQPYGITKESVVLQIEHDGKKSLWHIGKRHPMGKGVFVWNPSSTTLATAPHACAFHLLKKAGDFRNNLLITKGTKNTLHTFSVFFDPSLQYTIERKTDEGYILTKPSFINADDAYAENLWHDVHTLQAQHWTDAPSDASPSKTTPHLTLTYTDGSAVTLHWQELHQEGRKVYEVRSSEHASTATADMDWFIKKIHVPPQALQDLHLLKTPHHAVAQITLTQHTLSVSFKKETTQNTLSQWKLVSSSVPTNNSEVLALLHVLQHIRYMAPPVKTEKKHPSWPSIRIEDAHRNNVGYFLFGPPQEGRVVVIDRLKQTEGLVSNEDFMSIKWAQKDYQAP